MTITELQHKLRGVISDTAKHEFDVDPGRFPAEIPPKTELGDIAFPVAFELAKLVKQKTGEKQNPRAIAESLRTKIEGIEHIARAEIAGPGYLNVFFDRPSFLISAARSKPLPRAANESSPKVCVEHTSVNPNKAAHIGHVRNAVLGDTFARILRADGKNVEIQYYIDNTGVQVADVVVGFIYLKQMDLAAIRELDRELSASGSKFDYFCWDLYAKVGVAYQNDVELTARRTEVLHLIEESGNDTAELADYVATRNVECIVATMERFSIRYDLLPRESEILHLRFWHKAFDKMKDLGVVHLESEGKNKDCWVMPIDAHVGTDEHDSDKILVRSNGTVTYTGKDIAYQMWKLGMLGMDFLYKPFRKYADGKDVWTTTAEQSESQPPPTKFGAGETVYNVIDSRQSYTQDVVKKGVAAIAPERGEDASVHLAYEMVALSPKAAVELGFVISEDDKARAFIEMSGRKGLGVKADDLISRLEINALKEVSSRHPELGENEKRTIAHQLAVGGLRYFLLKFTRNTVIVFDFDEALSFEGETGCFCQYSAVRANSIFRKAAEAGIEHTDISDRSAVSQVLSGERGDEIWSLIMLASRLDETVQGAAAANEPAILAKYAFSLAKLFNLFYHNNKILSEPDAQRRSVLLSAADHARTALTAALDLMGIEVPEKM